MAWPHHFRQSVLGGVLQGEAWLQSLPQLLRHCEHRWQITLGPPFVRSFNYVAPAIDANGNSVVFKAGVPGPELISEIQALRLYDGDGAVRLLDSQRMLGYASAQSVLSAWWSFEDSETSWESALACAQTSRVCSVE